VAPSTILDPTTSSMTVSAYNAAGTVLTSFNTRSTVGTYGFGKGGPWSGDTLAGAGNKFEANINVFLDQIQVAYPTARYLSWFWKFATGLAAITFMDSHLTLVKS